MLYPACYIPFPKNVDNLLTVMRLIHPMGFNTNPIGRVGSFYIDNKIQCMIPGPPKDIENYQFVTIEQCLEIYSSFYAKAKEWVESLQVGSKVLIEPRHGNSEDYPYSYPKDMQIFSGQEMTIQLVMHDPSISRYRFYNGFPTTYVLKEAPEYTWHSSEFVFEDIGQKISTIPITEIKKLSFL